MTQVFVINAQVYWCQLNHKWWRTLFQHELQSSGCHSGRSFLISLALEARGSGVLISRKENHWLRDCQESGNLISSKKFPHCAWFTMQSILIIWWSDLFGMLSWVRNHLRTLKFLGFTLCNAQKVVPESSLMVFKFLAQMLLGAALISMSSCSKVAW